ncbi:MAG TPA: VWA domain-containing protein [Burkholderiales bacterium]
MAVHPSGFDPQGLDAPLSPLEDLPRSLWLQSLVNSVGSLAPRLRGIQDLRRGLTAGALPAAPEWPSHHAAAPFLDKIGEMELPRYCHERQDVADQVVQSLLWHCDRIIDKLDQLSPAEAAREAAEAFGEEWSRTQGEIDELTWVFGDLGDLLKAERFALVQGLLRTEGWQELLRIRRLLESMPELQAVIRALGRARQTEEPDLERRPEVEVLEKIQGIHPRPRETRIPEVAAETRGVQRSGRIARMLASEAALLIHPRLRLVWFARHAERALLTYEDDNRVRDFVMAEAPDWRRSATPQPQRKLEMGPMILCVDTSSSMIGPAEQVAKATVLEAMRTAAAQKRRCYVYAFSGPGEVVERELGLDADGITEAIAFLGQTFHGGTDIDEPLARALTRVEDEEWQLADLVVASDGQFGCTPDMSARVHRARDEAGLRVQGVLIGDRDTVGMLDVCNTIFRVKDWRKLGEEDAARGDGGALSRRYFPGIFSGPGDRATVSGGVITPKDK